MPRKKTIPAYKGFNESLQCRGFQYEVGETYKTDGDVEVCRHGFHACESPFDVWTYYGPHESRFAEVELKGATDDGGDDTKIAAAEIKIKAELTLPEFIKRGVDWLLENAKPGKSGDSEKVDGDSARIGSSGYSAWIGSSGYSARIGSSGDSAQIGSSGDSAQIGSSGYSAQIGSSGYSAWIGSSGYSARIGSSGYSARIGSSGYSAQIGSSGDSAWIGSSGYSARIGSSGDSAQINATGQNAVIASAGYNTRVKGAEGAWVSLAEFVDGKCIGFSTGCIGKNGLKPDTWYRAEGGKLVEDE